jgi:hypothetical protein
MITGALNRQGLPTATWGDVYDFEGTFEAYLKQQLQAALPQVSVVIIADNDPLSTPQIGVSYEHGGILGPQWTDPVTTQPNAWKGLIRAEIATNRSVAGQKSLRKQLATFLRQAMGGIAFWQPMQGTCPFQVQLVLEQGTRRELSDNEQLDFFTLTFEVQFAAPAEALADAAWNAANGRS